MVRVQSGRHEEAGARGGERVEREGGGRHEGNERLAGRLAGQLVHAALNAAADGRRVLRVLRQERRGRRVLQRHRGRVHVLQLEVRGEVVREPELLCVRLCRRTVLLGARRTYRTAFRAHSGQFCRLPLGSQQVRAPVQPERVPELVRGPVLHLHFAHVVIHPRNSHHPEPHISLVFPGVPVFHPVHERQFVHTHSMETARPVRLCAVRSRGAIGQQFVLLSIQCLHVFKNLVYSCL